jgi:hypothetical protein
MRHRPRVRWASAVARLKSSRISTEAQRHVESDALDSSLGVKRSDSYRITRAKASLLLELLAACGSEDLGLRADSPPRCADVRRAHGVEHHGGGETLATRRERCGPDAVVGGNAPDDDALQAARAQQSAEAGAVESRVLLERRIDALAHNCVRDRVDVGVLSRRPAFT